MRWYLSQKVFFVETLVLKDGALMMMTNGKFFGCCIAFFAFCGLAFANPWYFNSTDKVLSNEVWSLTVTISGSNLTLASRLAGSGDLDFTSLYEDTGYRLVAVGNSVFYKNTTITEFVAPDVTSVGVSAFSLATALTNVVISPNVSSLQNSCFYKCSGIVTFSPTRMEKLKGCGFHIFNGTSKMLLDFEFPVLTSISEGMFSGSAAISVRAPSATKVVSGGFSSSSVTLVELSPNLTSFANNSFLGSKKLKTFIPTTLPKLTSLGTAVFSGCSVLEGDWVFDSLTSFPKETFSTCPKITSIVAPKVKSVGNYAFKACTSLKKVQVSDALSSVGTQSFLSCTSLSDFSPMVLTNLTSTGNSSFNGCSALSGSWVAPKLTSLAEQCFTSTKIVSFIAPKMKTVNSHAFRYCKSVEHIVMLGGGAIGAYAFEGFAAGAVIDYLGDASPTSIGTGAFYPYHSDDYTRIYLRRYKSKDGWLSFVTPAASLDSSVTSRSDYPGKRTLGLYQATQSKAWVVDGDHNQNSIFTLR